MRSVTFDVHYPDDRAKQRDPAFKVEVAFRAIADDVEILSVDVHFRRK